MTAMVLDRKTLPKSLLSYFAAPRIAAIPRDGGVFLTSASDGETMFDLVKASETTLDFWDNEEDKVWDNV